jgi:ATP-binding cassette, subfamily C (CFTR/MRP), member 1
LNSSHIFTTLSLLSLITQPLDLLFSYVPEIIAGVACFSRIQNYVYDDGLSERPVVPETHSEKSPAPKSNKDASTSSDSDDGNEKILGDGAAIEMQSASFGWDAKTDPLLQNLDLKIASDKLTMITGPIASGKTTLLKGILGETPVCRGIVKLSTHSIAFCDQNPWLANETLRANILGTSHFEAARYNKVVDACALKQDIQQFSQGDQVNIGSNGLSLSGGQKQRVVSSSHCSWNILNRTLLTLLGNCTSRLFQTQNCNIRRCFQWSGHGNAIAHRARSLRSQRSAQVPRNHCNPGDPRWYVISMNHNSQT